MVKENSALLLIEFQNEWLDESGKLNSLLHDREQFTTSIKNAKNVLLSAREAAMHIIHSGLSYSHDYKELGQATHGLRSVIPMHKTFLANTYASQFADGFQPNDHEFVVQGRIASSAFSGSNLDSYLKNNNIKTLFIIGYALHVCVESTVRAAHDLGYEVIVIEDASAAFTQEQKKYFIDNVIHHFGSTITSNNFINSLRKRIN